MAKLEKLTPNLGRSSARTVVLELLLVAASLWTGTVFGQITMTNGGNHAGTLLPAETNFWAIPVTSGNRVILRAGAPGFAPRLDVFTQQGVLVGSAFSENPLNRDVTISFQATNTGVYTVQVRSQFAGSSGAYSLRLVRVPSPFVAPAGDEGGALASGAANLGTIPVGDLDPWSFPANAGDRIVLRMGTTNFTPQLNLYGPSGLLVASAFTDESLNRDVSLDVQVTNSGAYTVVASSHFSGGTGAYGLHLARLPGAFLVSAGDQGGFLTNGARYPGVNDLGDLDLWSFRGTVGDSNALMIVTTNFSPWLRLYNPYGVLVGEAGTSDPSNRAATLSHIVTTNGAYTLVTSAWLPGQSGTYSLRHLRVPPDLNMDTNTQTLAESESLSIPLSAQDPAEPDKPLTFSLVSGPAGAIVTPAGNTNAILSWIPGESDGSTTNRIIVGVTDTVSGTAFLRTNGLTVIVKEINSPPALPAPLPAPGKPAGEWTIDELTLSTTTVVASDTDLPANPLTYTLLYGPIGLTLSPQGILNWTPTEPQGPGVYSYSVMVTDTNPAAINEKQFSATNTYTVMVREVNNHAPTLAPLPRLTVNPGQKIDLATPATDGDWPPSSLSFELVSGPPGAVVTSGGSFIWRPALAQVSTTNLVEVEVQDNGSPSFSDVKSFEVVVKPLEPVVLVPLDTAYGVFRFLVKGSTGPDYIIMCSSNLTQWTDLQTNFSPATPFEFTDPTPAPVANRMYRIRLGP